MGTQRDVVVTAQTRPTGVPTPSRSPLFHDAASTSLTIHVALSSFTRVAEKRRRDATPSSTLSLSFSLPFPPPRILPVRRPPIVPLSKERNSLFDSALLTARAYVAHTPCTPYAHARSRCVLSCSRSHAATRPVCPPGGIAPRVPSRVRKCVRVQRLCVT